MKSQITSRCKTFFIRQDEVIIVVCCKTSICEINKNSLIAFERPSYYVAHCLFEHLDCKSLWRRKVTKMGTCIEFDPSLAVNQYNKSLEQELVKDMAFEVGDNQLRYNH